MRIFIQSPAADNWCDPPVMDILRQIPNRADSLASADVVIVPITFKGDFVFDEELPRKLAGKKWVLVNFTENGWSWDQRQSYLFGHDALMQEALDSNEGYRKFDDFVVHNRPILTFQRELLKKDVSDKVLPIDYLAGLPDRGMASREEFGKRPLEVSFNWGRSHEARMWMHGAIFQSAGRFGYDVVSEFSHVDKAIADNPGSLKWLSVHVPHYARIDVQEVQKVVERSRITVVLGGAGVKTFRHGEVAADAVMAIPRNGLAWAYPWDETNSIQIRPCKMPADAAFCVEQIMNHNMRPDLYEIYCAAIENSRRYRPDFYLRNHVMAQIEKVL